MRKTKVVCTIGPASDSVETLKKLSVSGMDVARLNFSHGTYEEHRVRLQMIRQAAKEMMRSVAMLLATPGPEIRTYTFADGETYLQQGSTVRICMEDVVGNTEQFSVTYEGLVNDLAVGTLISLDDGLIDLEVLELDKENGVVTTKVLNGGVIKNKKGVNVPNVRVNLPSLTKKDEADILFGIEENVDFIAASFVRDQQDVLTMRKFLEENDAPN